MKSEKGEKCLLIQRCVLGFANCWALWLQRFLFLKKDFLKDWSDGYIFIWRSGCVIIDLQIVEVQLKHPQKLG